jgi:hypothetical protein
MAADVRGPALAGLIVRPIEGEHTLAERLLWALNLDLT